MKEDEVGRWEDEDESWDGKKIRDADVDECR
jgi:hypothetical protein